MLFDAPDGPDAPDAPDVNDVGPKRELTREAAAVSANLDLGLACPWTGQPGAGGVDIHVDLRSAPFHLQGGPAFHPAEVSPVGDEPAALPAGADLTGWAMRPTAIGRLLWSLAIYLAGLIAWFLVVLGSLRYLR
jgi:hypothetical protein